MWMMNQNKLRMQNLDKMIRHVIFNVFKDQDRDIYYRLLQADC